MPKFLYMLFLVSAGCICAGAPGAAGSVLDARLVAAVQPDARGGNEPLFDSRGQGAEVASDGNANLPEAKVRGWREPGRQGERRYAFAIRQWLNAVAPFQRECVLNIMREAYPGLQALRMAIRDKKSQLASISFGRDTTPETLPRLGLELQALRAALRARLKLVDERLRHEAGVNMGPIGGAGFWFAPPVMVPVMPQSNLPQRPVEKAGPEKGPGQSQACVPQS